MLITKEVIVNNSFFLRLFSNFLKMDESIILALTVILAAGTGQQIINFEKAKSLKRDPEKGIFYALFLSHLNRRLDISPLVTTALQSRQECAQQCAENTKCFSFNLASVADVQDKLRCELLPSDIYNRSDQFSVNPSFHHFSIKVDIQRHYLILRYWPSLD